MTAQVQMPSGQPEEGQQVAPLGSLMGVSLENYKWAKDLVASNKTLGPRMSPLIEYTEETTLSVLKKSPIQVEDIVTAVDTRVDRAVHYGSDTFKTVREGPSKITNKTLKSVHERLNQLKLEGDEDVSEPGVSTIAGDAKVITTERLSKLLDASEGYLAQYLPVSEEDRETLKVDAGKGEFKPIAIRAGRQGKVAAVRLQEQALAKVSGLKKRTSEVVHVDLVKYSEFLDKQKSNVKQTFYVTLDKIDESLIKPTKETATKATDAVKNRVINPAKERIVSIELPFKDRIVYVWTVVGDEYDARVVQPRDQIVKLFREELASQQDLAKQKSGEDLTITAGLKAVLNAASHRFSKEWEVRVSPTIAKVLGRKSGSEKETTTKEEVATKEDAKQTPNQGKPVQEELEEEKMGYADEEEYLSE
mmetsp:Transcript_22588/g.42275  ORF Transcript_22588/g.42275 Transcript_22588/m.42275 type:complete len:419 (+) Transcript_22588:204-1460(+)